MLASTERDSAITAAALSAAASLLRVQREGRYFRCRGRHACRFTSSALCCCSASAPDHRRCAEQQPMHAILPADDAMLRSTYSQKYTKPSYELHKTLASQWLLMQQQECKASSHATASAQCTAILSAAVAVIKTTNMSQHCTCIKHCSVATAFTANIMPCQCTHIRQWRSISCCCSDEEHIVRQE